MDSHSTVPAKPGWSDVRGRCRDQGRPQRDKDDLQLQVRKKDHPGPKNHPSQAREEAGHGMVKALVWGVVRCWGMFGTMLTP